LGFAGDAGEDLEDGGEALLVLKFVGDSQSVLHLFLDHGDGFGGDGGGGLLLEERGSFHFGFEESSDFGDDCGCLFVLLDLFFEISGFLGSGGIEFVDLLLVVLNFLGLGVDDAGHDGSSGVEVALELSFELDSLGVAFSEVLIVGGDVVVASGLEIVVSSIGFLLFSDVPVLQVVEGADEGVEGVSGLELKGDCVEQGLSECGGIDPVDESDVIVFSGPDGGDN
jgi:hypothetical protein